MRAYRTAQAVVFEDGGKFHPSPGLTWDEFVRASQHSAQGDVNEIARQALRCPALSFDPSTALAPIVSQEVWAAGVTYYRSREARMSESKDAGGGDFYARVYDAERPELFFKATGRRVVGPGATVRIRSDARWSVAEPELTLLANPSGHII